MWWPFKKNKFNKLKREEVVNSIIELTKREEDMEQSILEAKAKINDLYAKGKAEKDPTLRLLYAKKINFAKGEIKNATDKAMYLLYNLKLLNQLKDTIDENDFITTVGNENLSELLGDQKHLAEFLNKSLKRKIAAEEILTSADDVFQEVSSTYQPDEKIYGLSNQDDEVLAMFENDDIVAMASGLDDEDEVSFDAPDADAK